MSKYAYLILAVALLLSCQEDQQETGYLLVRLPASQTGIDFSNQLAESDSLNILDYLYFYNGGGVGIGDFDKDGLPDIYLAANQGKNKLYHNKGRFLFDDITQKAGVAGNSDWNTGVTVADINNDGWLDIVVSAVVGINGFEGHHEVYINNKDLSFTERSAEYGLDLEVYGTMVASLDYDLDGDLDLYYLNHAVHTQESFGRSQIRAQRDPKTGDRLMRNDGDHFTDVSEEVGIYGGPNGYGLGVSVADFNRDGYPDLYIGNDFHEDDYYYINNGDGTFTESLKKYFGHSSRFSMGNDAADINNDGLVDLISLDMLPADESVVKASEGDDAFQTLLLRTRQYGYHYQFSRNMLYVHQPDSTFSEVALQAGVAATDWSWSALFADFDQDGQQDLFISNGIPRRPNDLDFIRFLSNEEIQAQVNSSRLVDQQALDLMPSGVVPNYVYQGREGFGFSDRSNTWIEPQMSVSGASAIADLDGDGDLDLVVNNLDQPATILENRQADGHYLKVRINSESGNYYGYGSKVTAYYQGRIAYRELNPHRGFQATSEPLLHFGLGNSTLVDSLVISSPYGVSDVLFKVAVDTTLVITSLMGSEVNRTSTKSKQLFQQIPDKLGIDYVHIAQPYQDFTRQKLIPYGVSDRGPKASWANLDGDGLAALFVGGVKKNKPARFVQGDGYFERADKLLAGMDGSIEADWVIADLHEQAGMELLIPTLGGDRASSLRDITNRLYNCNNGELLPLTFDLPPENTAVIRPSDIDGDGDLDLFVGNYVQTNHFGKPTDSRILINTDGDFQELEVEGLKSLGMVTDAIWDDFNGDGSQDLIVVGEWMSPKFFANQDGQLEQIDLLSQRLSGLWQAVHPFDIDQDGDMDYVLGNWGENSKFKVSPDYPMQMHVADFDQNGAYESVVSTAVDGQYYPLLGLDELSGQMVFLRKKFNNYSDFAGLPIDQVLDPKALADASLLEVDILSSGFLRNNGGDFNFVAFNEDLQTAPIRVGLEADFDQDGTPELLLAGNFVDLIPFHGRLDAFGGALIHNEERIDLGAELGLNLTNQVVSDLELIELDGETYLLVLIYDGPAKVYRIK